MHVYMYSTLCMQPVQDSPHDEDSTPLSLVEHLFTSLLLKIFDLDESSLLRTLRNFEVYKFSLVNEPLLRNIPNTLTNEMIQYINSFLSFINYTLLESILKPHYSDSDLRDYIRQLENLKISELPPLLHHTKTVEGFCCDLVVIQYHSDVRSVEDLNQIKQTFCS